VSGAPDLSDLTPPDGVLVVLSTLESAGHEAWAVGGALRDRIAGTTFPHRVARSDWDVATDARPEEVISLFPRTVPLGVEHGTVGVLGDDNTVYETTTFRLDVETDGRHATVEFADNIDDDLARRDFTINAMAWRWKTGEFRDPFGGREDLDAGLLKAVGEPVERFAEDYLRVLRGLRFAGRFDLEIETETKDALVEAAAHLGTLSAERVREELVKILEDPCPSTALDLYAECGALEPWFPELSEMAGDRASWRRHLGTLDGIRPHRAPVRLGRLLVPLAEDADARASAADRLLERLKFSNADRRRVVHLVRSALPFVSPVDSSAHLRAWLSEVRGAWRDLFRLHAGAVRDAGDPRAIGALVAAWRSVHDEVLDHPPLQVGDLAISGTEVLALGVPPGPVVGLLLEELLAQVLEDPDRNDPRTLTDEARRLIDLGSLAGPRPDGGGGGGG
jgi:tRNA nucleotidyltransferase (CCA-adding enzyme)